MVTEISGLIVELYIWVLAGYRIYALRMPLRKRVCAISAFGVRLLYVSIASSELFFAYHQLINLV